MANASSSTVAVAALMQKASQQYLECRRRVTAKSDEVSNLDSEIQSLFERITVSSTSTARGAKSVGRLELSIVAVEGDAPVDDAVITVEIDPEYEEPEAPVVETKAEEEEEEKKTTEEVKQAEAQEESEASKEEVAETAEEATEEEAEKTEEATEEATEEEAEKTEEATEEKAEQSEEAAVEKEETPVAQRRSVAWSDADSLPLSLVFDPVQSREAVVTISIAAPAEDGEESEPVKEFRIPVSSLFQTGLVNRWYVIKKVEHIHTDKAAITEVADEDEPTPVAADAEEPVKEEEEEECSAEEAAEKTEDTETPAATEEESVESATEKVVKVEEGDEPKAEEEEEPKTEETVAAAPHQTLVEATATVQSEDTVVVLKEGKLHVQVHFTMSEIEKLSQTAIALSQQKQEAEATLAALEREAASLRTKYERLSASQRSMSTGAGGVVKPRSTLLGGRGLGGAAGMAAAPRVEKSSFQKIKDSVAATLTPQRTQVLTSFAIFVGSVALFHFQGDNLLA